jgi:signal transduction histidine kinase/ligand-binding sensor domain-containing protein
MCGVLPAQDRNLRHYSVDEGLSQSSVISFLQDKTGYMWIATGDGLNRFDGYKFTTFKNENGNINSLSNNTIRGLLEDNKGNIWIGTENGLNTYDPVSNTISRIPLKGIANRQKSAIVPLLVNENILYFWMRSKGILAYDIKSGIILVKSPKIDSAMTEAAIYHTTEGFWYSRKRSYLEGYKPGQGEVNDYHISFPYPNTDIYEIKPAGNNKFLLCTTTGLWIYSTQNKKCAPYIAELKGKNIKSIIIDDQNNTYAAVSGEGMYVFDAGKHLKRIYDNYTATDGQVFSMKTLTVLHKGSSGNIWIGSDGAGFFVLSLAQLKFSTVNSSPASPYKLSGNFIKCFLEIDNTLYVGTYKDGLNVINKKDGILKVYKHVEANLNSFPDNTITSLLPDSSGIWVGTEKGLCFFNIAEKTFTAVREPGNTNSPIYNCYKLAKGNILVSMRGSVFQLIKGKHPTLIQSSIAIAAKTFFENGKDILIGTTLHGFKIFRDGKLIIPQGLNEGGIDKASFQYFSRDKNGNIWAATDIGLLKFSNDYKLLKIYDKKYGLPDNFVYGILVDKGENLWVSSNRGISKFNPQTEKFKNFGLNDGIQSFEFNTGALYKNTQGEMFFGGINGFNYFTPESISLNQHLPKVVLTDFKINDKETNTIPANNKYIELPYYNNTVSFEYAGLEFSDPLSNQYAYKLEGLEKDWFYCGNKRFLRYSGLEAGVYHLLIKSSNNDGIWSEPKELIMFTILSPYWKAWWFYTIIAMLVIAITTVILRFLFQSRLRERLAELERHRQMEKIRQRISSDIHDDIGSGLTKISLISQMAKMDMAADKNIESHLTRLSGSAIDLSERLQEIVWAMNPRHDDLNSMVSFFRAYAADYFEDTNMSIRFDFPNNAPPLPLNPDLRRNLFLCIKEALNNIVKHANASTVELKIKLLKNALLLEIRDNGAGFDTNDNKALSNGLINMSRRMEEVNGKLSVISSPGSGTSLSFNVPVF